MLRDAPLGFAFWDADLRIVHVNEFMAAIVGTSVADALARRMDEIVPDYAHMVRPVLERVRQTGRAVVDVEMTGPSAADPGVTHHYLVSYFPVFTSVGQIDGIGLVNLDITVRKRAERQIRLLGDAAELFAEDRDIDTALEAVARVPVPELAEVCMVVLTDSVGAVERSVTVSDQPQFIDRSTACPLGIEVGSAPHRALLAGRTLLVGPAEGILSGLDEPDDLAAGPPLTPPSEQASVRPMLAALRARGVASALLVPMRTAGRPVGYLALLLTQQGRLHDLDEIGLGGILSQRFAQFLVNVQLQEQAARAQAALELLAAAAGVVEGDLDVGGRATFIARLAVPQLADHAEVYLADRFKHGLRFAGGAHGDPRTAADLDHVAWPVVDPAGPTDVAHAFRTGRLTPSRDADRDSSHVLPQDSRLRTALASRAKLNIPLPGPNGPIGVLVLGLRGTRRFRPEDARLGRELARVAAPALNNALRFEQERLTGVTLQRSLLPRDVPAVAGARVATRYVPSTAGLEVGGDWYDVVELPDGELLLAIGDVAGHSIEAAVSMGRYRTVLQFAAAEGLEPAEMLRRINEFMVTAFPSEMATLCIVSYDPRAGVATAASAGHLPPVITLPDGSTRIWSVKPGLPLGVVANVDFEQESIAMEPQTFLVLYTDGLVERRGETLDTGIARLRECCGRRFGSPEELAAGLLSELIPDGADDDVALLVAEVTLAGADFHLRFRADAAQLASLRRDLRRWLGAVPPLQERIEDVVLAANEAVANAIEHAYADVPAGPVTVRGHLGEHDLALSVTDRGRWRAPGTDSSRGRGLELMGTLSDEVDVRRSETGSTVVFRFAFAAPAEN